MDLSNLTPKFLRFGNSKRTKGILASASLIGLSALIIFTAYYIKNNYFDIRERATVYDPPSELPFSVSINPLQITAGGSYTISIVDSAINQLPYQGYVFIKSYSCPDNGECTLYSGIFNDNLGNPIYFSNGQATVSVAEDALSGVISMRFTTADPVKKIDWSPQVQLTIYDPDVIPTDTLPEEPTPTPIIIPTDILPEEPTPTYIEDEDIYILTNSTSSCTQVCESKGYICLSVGLDAEATDGKIQSKKTTGNTCAIKSSHTSPSILSDKKITCGGKRAEWTYCKCTTGESIEPPLPIY